MVTAATPIASAPATDPRRDDPPPRLKYTIVELVLTYLRERVKDVIKGLGYIAFWVNKAVSHLPESVNRFSLVTGDIKNIISALEAPEKAHKFWNKLKSLVTVVKDRSTGKINSKTRQPTNWYDVGDVAREAFKEGTGLINNVADGIDFSTRYIHINRDALRCVKGVSFAATLGGSAVTAAEQIQKIRDNHTVVPEKQKSNLTLALINLASAVSYLVLGIIGLYFVLTATPIVVWMLLACLTAGLAFSMTGFFYERIVDPEGKGKNLNPNLVVENFVKKHPAIAASAA